MAKKLDIMIALTELLEGTPGYDLPGRVFRGRREISIKDVGKGQGALSLMESPRPQVGDGAGFNEAVRKNPWTINVQGWPIEDRDHPSDPAYLMAEAVEDRLRRVLAVGGSGTIDEGLPAYPEHYMLGNRITGMVIADSVVLPGDNLSSVGFFYIPIVITFVR